ncbi:hypothetical protein HanXRQr2_MTg0835371 (mitochondrion) [Helianthus annuus]|uniref:Uncharacterized protein n=1 Tax=Helianthus annuus TaxID=4232 RepID=A0A2P1MA72_HELAN|nr:hypothetical protein [Helianthus annuus]AVP27577.1 hypothetical protein [Helianthus annuus]KAF5753178.1 hypothetical protein HanXRQr2_MTg0835371 [Helianthus annuus]KAJ0440318.1 hypothetical protein HanHA89_MTg0756051 [Helianthus annuus]KAJ0807343.1 hypothetical protein HanOQP8_Chr00c049g0733831 [Helianthus annuus]
MVKPGGNTIPASRKSLPHSLPISWYNWKKSSGALRASDAVEEAAEAAEEAAESAEEGKESQSVSMRASISLLRSTSCLLVII